jgi:hypothetical protein
VGIVKKIVIGVPVTLVAGFAGLVVWATVTAERRTSAHP